MIMKELPVRKNIRLKGYDYSTDGCYFITICVKDKHEILGEVVGDDAHIVPPYVKCTEYGNIVDKYVNNINVSSDDVNIPKYVIMPNHIHLIVVLKAVGHGRDKSIECGEDTAVGHGNPTLQSVVGRIKSYTAKRWSEMCGEKYQTFWQSRFYDEIIRNEETYQNIWHYIDENPQKWAEDDYFIKN